MRRSRIPHPRGRSGVGPAPHLAWRDTVPVEPMSAPSRIPPAPPRPPAPPTTGDGPPSRGNGPPPQPVPSIPPPPDRAGAGQFLREVHQELRTAQWSDRPSLRRNVEVVLAVLLALVALIVVFDLALGWSITEIYGS